MGWSSGEEKLPYVHCLYEEEDFCIRKIMESDCVLAGWSGREDLIEQRLNAGKLTFVSLSGFTVRDSGKPFHQKGYIINTKSISDTGTPRPICYVPGLCGIGLQADPCLSGEKAEIRIFSGASYL